ncbi:MAG: hypothetical protein J6A38_03625 [Clostridia bacterium]|nr:hypothetical protein [Clostridia bacterium]
MKLEKREITLNEQDSLKDVFYMEKVLLGEYTIALSRSICKETRESVLRLCQGVTEDLSFVRELTEKSAKNCFVSEENM